MPVKRYKWTNEEIDILISNYKYGINHVFDLLNKTHTKKSISDKAGFLKLKVTNKSIYDIDFVKNAVLNSNNFTEAFRQMKNYSHGNGFKYFKKFIINNNIDYSHFYKNNIKFNKIELNDILNGSKLYKNTCKLKERLYKEGLKERKCELCGQGEEWNGKHMSLILDHINGNHTDNRIENLRIVCPNCNATLPTHCRGHKKQKLED